MAESLLHGSLALDLTDEKGFICGQVLAAIGVQVIKVEKPGGDPARNIPPFLETVNGERESLQWLAFNTGKAGITLNLKDYRGQEIFRKLAAQADFVLESFTPGYLDSLGLGYEKLSCINPGIIMTSITPFGQKGPYAKYKGNELVASAMSGVLLTNGDPDRPPVRDGPDAITFQTNMAALLGSVMAYHYQKITGEGQQVDVSMQEVALSRSSVNLTAWEFDKRLLKRSGAMRTEGIHRVRIIWRCKDGYVFWAQGGGLFGASANRALSRWMDDDGMENPLREVPDWDVFDMATVSTDTLQKFEAAISKFFLNHTKKEIAEEGLKRGINACVVNNPADILESRQLKTRDYWANVQHSELNTSLRYPGHFFISNRTENYISHRAPFIGENNDEIYKNRLGLPESQITALREAGVI
jgi:crotonobetainyl-CoA:carnitine CoA-transferase CaiB-like acyl-CoA transferase